MTCIFIVDDQAVVREGVKQMIDNITDMLVIGESEVSQDLLSQVRAQPVDVVILGLSALGRSGMEILHDLRQAQPDVPVLVLSGYAEHRDAAQAFKAGAKGYLAKESEPEDLIQAIRQVAQGRVYVSPALADRLIRALIREAEPPLHAHLSKREYQVLCLLGSGKSLSGISEELSLSIKTVSTYRSRLLEKLHRRTTAELIRYAIEHRLVE